MKKSDMHMFQGMTQDPDPLQQKPEFLVDARNIRMTPRGENTGLSVTTEKGSLELVRQGNTSIIGKYLGHCVIGEYVTIFTTMNNGGPELGQDRIYRVKVTGGNYTAELLFKGNLHFDPNYSMDTLASYENSLIQKVYWTDGKNQPRVINITKKELNNTNSFNGLYTNDSFNFVNELKLEEEVHISKVSSDTGSFPAGCVQYCFSYFNKYGQESNIAWTSPIYYTSLKDRAGSPEETINNSFKIVIKNPDTNFDYIRLYSVFRTTENGTPNVKRVTDILIKENQDCVYTDSNLYGETVDPTFLLYVGGEEITARTIAQKDGTMFLGNLKITRPPVLPINKNDIKSIPISVSTTEEEIVSDYSSDFYDRVNTLEQHYTNGDLVPALTFKQGEYYRLGVQFQYKNGKWSEPVFIKDFSCDKAAFINNDIQISYPIMQATILGSLLSEVRANGYKKARAVIVLPSEFERKIVAQGVLCPTVYSVANRVNGRDPYVQSSWFTRPFATIPYINRISIRMEEQYGSVLQFKHNYSLFSSAERAGEIEGVPGELGNKTYQSILDRSADTTNNQKLGIYVNRGYGENMRDYVLPSNMESIFCVDQHFVTFHSPDIELSDYLYNIDFNGLTLKFRNKAVATHSCGDINILTSSIPVNPNKGRGILHYSTDTNNYIIINGRPLTGKAGRSLSAGLFYEDYFVEEHSNEEYNFNKNDSNHLFMVYPWQKQGSLNNDKVRPEGRGSRSAVLKTKKISNIHIYKSYPFSHEDTVGEVKFPTHISLFKDDVVSLTKLGEHTYFGNVDTMLSACMNDGKIIKQTSTPDALNWELQGIAEDNIDNALDSDGELTFITKVRGVTYLSKEGTSRGTTFKIDSIDDSTAVSNAGKSVSIMVNKAPIRMRYKSTPHLIIDLGEKSTDSGDIDITLDGGYESFADPFLYIADLVRKDPPTFGGNDENALENNLWLPAGESVPIGESGDLTITYRWGDTYYQRYDNIKTYPFDLDDENQIIDINSFMVETRVNCDGRYDRNRGLRSNLNMSPKNFNLINKGYTQQDNYFNYRILDEDYYKLSEYPNTVTWTLEKKASDEVDNWTQITMAATAEVDGDKGEVSALKNFNNTLYCFQKSGISKLMFNSIVEINNTSGVPIEIANNYKMSGKIYISTNVGTDNLYSTVVCASGIYFIDYQTKDLYSLGEQFNNVSVTKQMSVWFDNLKPDIYNLKDRQGNCLYYDFNNSDLYIRGVNKKGEADVLNFSELLGNFVSFFDYSDYKSMFNLNDRFIGITENNGEIKLEAIGENPDNGMHWGGLDRDYKLSFISNSDAVINKLFTNIEAVADAVKYEDGVSSVLHFDKPFDSIRVTNEYQDTGDIDLNNSNQLKKFRIWRINIPRHKTVLYHDRDNELSPVVHRIKDRISNTWARITLKGSKPLKLHNLDVVYYI